MNHPHKANVKPTPESTFSNQVGYISPMADDSEAWGLGHKRSILYWAIYTGIITSLMMLSL